MRGYDNEEPDISIVVHFQIIIKPGWLNSWRGQEIFPYSTPSRLALGPTQTHPMGTEGSFFEVKAALKPNTHLHLVSRLRIVGLTSTPPYVFMVWCLINYTRR
jgi:hypothetical protein